MEKPDDVQLDAEQPGVPPEQAESAEQTVGQRLVDLLERVDGDPEGALQRMERLYAEEMVFSDPLQTLRSREAFMRMNRRLLDRSRRLHFDVRQRVEEGDRIFLLWRMEITPRFGPSLAFDGTTFARVVDGLVVEHQDHWDLLGPTMGAVPLLGRLYRALTRRLV